MALNATPGKATRSHGPGIFPSIWVTIIGSQVQPGGFLTLTLHPSHAQETFPVNVVRYLRPTCSHSQLR